MEVSDAKKLKRARGRESAPEADGGRPGARHPGAESGRRKKMVRPAGVPPSRRLPAERVRVQRTPGVQCARLPALELPVRHEADDGAGTARRDSSSRRGSPALRLPSHPRAASAWRLAREPQAGLPHLSRRRPGCPTEKAQTDGRRAAHVLPPPSRPNERWSMDFTLDTLASGRRFRTLNVVDDFTRECLAIEVDTSLGGARVVRVSRPATGAIEVGPRSSSATTGPSSRAGRSTRGPTASA